MFKCDECEKEFQTYRGLNGHKRMHGDSKGQYSVSRKKVKLPNATCLYCRKEFTFSPKSSTGKFCCMKCHQNYKWENITIPNILNGKGGNLKTYLIKTQGYVCKICGISHWNNKPLSLHMDHIDGNSDNNIVENVRLLCPNCHSQTETFSGRNTKNTKRNRYLQKYKSEKKQK